MSMVCAQCNQVFAEPLRQCPKCGIQLLVQHRVIGNSDDDAMARTPDPMSRWQQTPWGRIVVSVLIAQGLAFCFQQMSQAWFLASGVEGDRNFWISSDGIVWLHLFNLVSVLLCAILAGANQERGITSGAIVGLWSGLIFLVLHRASKDSVPAFVFFAPPFLHMLVGVLGGFIGYRIWRPVPLFSMDDGDASSGMSIPFRNTRRIWRGPIHIVRILVGVVVTLAGVLLVKEILEFIIASSNGAFQIKSHWVDKLVRYQIMGVVIMIGGMIAGSTVYNGFKQGFIAGLISASLYLGIQLANPKSVLEVTLFTMMGIFVLSIAGAVFGRTLFPAVVKGPTKKLNPY